MRDGTVFAIRRDGSSSKTTSRSILDKDGVSHRTVISRYVVDVKFRTKTRVDHFTESLTTAPLSAAELREAVVESDKGSCVTSVDGGKPTVLGNETVVGLSTVHVLQEKPYPASPGAKELLEIWYAPALSCLELRRNASLVLSDGRIGGRNALETISIVLAEPDAGLFEIPAHYSERAPSEVMAERDRRVSDGSCALCITPARHREEIDRQYHAARRAAGRP